MIIRFLSALFASFIGIYTWVAILNFLDPIYNFSETVFGFMIYYAPIMFMLIVATKCTIYIIKRSETVKSFLKSEVGFFLTLLVPMSLLIPLKDVINSNYNFKASFIVAYLIAMQVYLLLEKISSKYFKNGI